jgi:hypothetical protein
MKKTSFWLMLFANLMFFLPKDLPADGYRGRCGSCRSHMGWYDCCPTCEKGENCNCTNDESCRPMIE